jgi:hypothetical protein
MMLDRNNADREGKSSFSFLFLFSCPAETGLRQLLVKFFRVRSSRVRENRPAMRREMATQE